MMRSLYAGISGLKNHQTRMDVIGNNIANVNTVGFKSSRVTFQDMLSQTIQGASGATGSRGGTNPMQIGLGMGLASVDTIFTDGSFQPTGKQTDLAIGGQGFFILSDGQNQIYSRAGAFDFDTAGNFLVPGTGYKVMGYKADSNGVIDPNQPVQGINIPVGGNMAAKLSSKVTYANNLSASATASIVAATATTSNAAAATSVTNWGLAVTAVAAGSAATITAVNNAQAAAVAAKAATLAATLPPVAPATTATLYTDAANKIKIAANLAKTAADLAAADSTLSAANIAAVNTARASADATLDIVNTTSDVQTTINLYDSQGNSYKLNGTFEKVGTNAWSFTPASTVTDSTGAVVANITATPSIISYKADGSYDAANSTINAITINPAGGAYAGAGSFSISPDFATMTQFGGESTAQATNQDGYASGTLSKVTIDPTGTIVGQFTNGQSLNLAQVALAVFNNPSGLNKVGESLYTKSNNSGEPQIGQANTGGRGNFNPGSLEMSNVDLASEFSNMIVTQRGFQANSKIITTTDSMLEELVNLKR